MPCGRLATLMTPAGGWPCSATRRPSRSDEGGGTRQRTLSFSQGDALRAREYVTCGSARGGTRGRATGCVTGAADVLDRSCRNTVGAEGRQIGFVTHGTNVDGSSGVISAIPTTGSLRAVTDGSRIGATENG